MTLIRSLSFALLLIPFSLSGQESTASDTARFHGGQWGMQFGGGSDLFSLGVLRFTSARSAWLLDLSTSVTFVNARSTDKFGGTTTSADQQFVNFAVRLGRRTYQSPRRSVVSFQTLAVEGAVQDQMIDVSVGNVRQTIWSAGLHGELGGAYLLTPSVSVGGTAGISAGYLSFKQDDPAAADKGSGFYFDGVRVVLALGLYF